MNKCKQCGGEPRLLRGAVLDPVSHPLYPNVVITYQENTKFYQYLCSECSFSPSRFCLTEEEAKEAWETECAEIKKENEGENENLS